MKKISDLDKNFKVETKITKEEIVWLDANEFPFSIYGLLREGNDYVRVDSSLAKEIQQESKEGTFIEELNSNTSGGRLTFVTDSSYVALSMKEVSNEGSRMAGTGSRGFDCYIDEGNGFEYYQTFTPPEGQYEGYESMVEFNTPAPHKVLIHFPLYASVSDLMVGLDKDCYVDVFHPYKDVFPVVYYGSSITQGGCASRPGINFPAIVSMKTGVDFRCLGFSGSAHGEQKMAEYVAKQPMSAFVLDYDHNDLNNPELLQKRQMEFYRIVRKKNPEIPILMMTAPYMKQLFPRLQKSRDMLFENYLEAKKTDKNLYFIDGLTVFGENYKECATVDGCHPNDFGFVMMADAVLDVVKKW